MSSEFNESHERGDIMLMPVTSKLAIASQDEDGTGFPESFLMAPDFEINHLAPGDSVNVKLWERDGLRLYVPDASGISDLGEMTLDSEGLIDFPYVGKIYAQGLTISQLHDLIVQQLERIVIATDVSVQALPRRGQRVVVYGDFSKPGVYSLDKSMLRLTGLLALAAPDQNNAEQLAITVHRQGNSGSVRLADIFRSPLQNIALYPNDVVVAHHIVEYFTILGAASGQKRIQLSKRNYSVADALGEANGLNDSLSDPKAVYLMRKSDLSRLDSGKGSRPIVYQFDFTQPEQMLLASHFVVHKGDEIYISDAPFTQVQKVLSVFSSALNSTRPATGIAQ